MRCPGEANSSVTTLPQPLGHYILLLNLGWVTLYCCWWWGGVEIDIPVACFHSFFLTENPALALRNFGFLPSSSPRNCLAQRLLFSRNWEMELWERHEKYITREKKNKIIIHNEYREAVDGLALAGCGVTSCSNTAHVYYLERSARWFFFSKIVCNAVSVVRIF